MHFLIGLGILAVLVGFAFGEGAAKTLIGVVLVGVVAVFGFLMFGVVTDSHRSARSDAVRGVACNFSHGFSHMRVVGANYAEDDGRLSTLTYEDGRLETSPWGLFADKNGVVTDQGKPVGRCDLASKLPKTCLGWVVTVRNNLGYIEDANGKFWRVAANGLIADDKTHEAAGTCNPDEIVTSDLYWPKRAEAQRKEAAAEAERKQPVVMICNSGLLRNFDGSVREVTYVPGAYEAVITKMTELVKDGDYIIERAAPAGFTVNVYAGNRDGVSLVDPGLDLSKRWGYCVPKSSGRQVSCDAQYFPNDPKLRRRIASAILYGKPGGFLVAFHLDGEGGGELVEPLGETGEFGRDVWKGRCTVGG